MTAWHPCSTALQSILLCEGELLGRGKGEDSLCVFLLSLKIGTFLMFNFIAISALLCIIIKSRLKGDEHYTYLR